MNKRIAAVLILGLLAGLFFLRSTPLLFLVLAVGTGLAGVGGLTLWPRETRRWQWALGIAGLAWIILRCVIDGDVRALFLGEAMFFAVAAECIRTENWQKRSVVIPGLTVVALACVMQQRIAFTELGVFSFLGICVVVAVGWFSTQNRIDRPQFAAKRLAVAAAVLGVSGFTSFKVSEAWGEQVSVLENQIDTFLARFTIDDHLTQYSRSGDLNSISLGKIRNPDGIAFRVYSAEAPGYMVGKVFDVFNGRSWVLFSPQNRDNKGERRFMFRQPSSSSGIRVPQGESIFEVSKPGRSGRFTTYEITNVRGRGYMVFTPRGTRYVRGYGDRIVIDDYGTVHSGLNAESKYYAYADPEAKDSLPFTDRPADDPMRESAKQLELYVPDNAIQRFKPLADQLLEGTTSFDEQRQAIVNYFVDNYRYSLRPIVAGGGESLLGAFMRQKEGHCELFATAAAIILRLQGVRARYVTGYTCRDRDPKDDDYWAAVNRNAHAWVEAWDEENERWVLVEATPGMAEAAEAEATTASGDAQMEEVEEEDGGSSGLNLSDGRWIRRFQWTGIISTCLMLFWVWWKFSDKGEEDVANAAILRLDKKLAKKGMTRRVGETLHEFADRIESATGLDVDKKAAANFYRSYAGLLYGGNREQLALLQLPETALSRT
ncbi:MAG: transglutaminase family protein [Planctomycetaceae bacterium]